MNPQFLGQTSLRTRAAAFGRAGTPLPATPGALGTARLTRGRGERALPDIISLVTLTLCAAASLLWAPSGVLAADSPPPSEAQLIAVLQSQASPAEKALTCKKLAVYGGKSAVPALAPLLADPELNAWARIGIEPIPGPEADAALREALGKLRGRQLVGVISSIAVRRDPQAVSGLAARLKGSDAQVIAAAADALGRIGGDEAARALGEALASASPVVRSDIAEGCVMCASRFLAAGESAKALKLYDAVRAAEVSRQRKLEATRGAILARQSAGIPLLLEQLRSPDRGPFGLGLSTARELPGPDVTTALAAEMPNLSEERQPFLLLALADRHDPAGMPAIIKAAQTGSKTSRITAVGILDRAGDKASVPVLLTAATDADSQIAQAGKLALAKIEGAGVEAELLKSLTQATGKGRLVLVEVAGQRRMTAALPTVAASTQDADPALRRTAVESLGAIGTERQAPDLVALLQKTADAPDREAIRKALTAICGRSGTACVPALLPLAGERDSALRMMGLHLLASVGGPQALAAVTKAVTDRDEAVQDDAVGLLATWPNNWPEDVAVAQPLLELAKSGKKPAHQVQGVRGYLQFVQESKQLGDTDKVAKVKDLLGLIQRPEEKRLAIAALGSIPTAASLDLLTTLAADRAIAEEACLAIVAVAPSKNLKDVTKEQRQKALQMVLTASQNAATKKKAEDTLKAL